MKIAVAVEDQNGVESMVAQHFGRSPYFAFADMDGETVSQIEVVENPFAAGHAHGQVPTFIRDQGAEVIISGGMGAGAVGFFDRFGIKTATGASGTVGQAVERYFKGELSEDAACDHEGGHHHQHQHQHHGQH